MYYISLHIPSSFQCSTRGTRHAKFPNSDKAPSFLLVPGPNNGASLCKRGAPPRAVATFLLVANWGRTNQLQLLQTPFHLPFFSFPFSLHSSLIVFFFSSSPSPPVSLVNQLGRAELGSRRRRHAVQVVYPRFSGLAGLWRSCSRGAFF